MEDDYARISKETMGTYWKNEPIYYINDVVTN